MQNPRRIMVVVGAATAALLSLGGGAHAAESLVSGTAVRVTAPGVSATPMIGTLIDADETTLRVVVPERGEVRVPREAIQRLEWSLGKRSRAKKGAIWGAAIGAVVAGGGVAADREFGYCGNPGDSCVPYAAALGALGGAIDGALIGLFIRRHDWNEVPASAPVKLAIKPTPKGAQVGLTLSW